MGKSKSLIIIAHKLSSIKKADIILVMNKGLIVERGTHEELMELGGVYRDMYLKQESGRKEEFIQEVAI